MASSEAKQKGKRSGADKQGQGGNSVEKVILDKVCRDTVMSRGEQSSQQQQELTINEFYEQCAGKEDGGLRSSDSSVRRPRGGGEGTRTRPKAKALAARAEATVRATVEKARRRLPGQRLWNQGELPLDGSTRPWADDGPLTVAQQAKAVLEEDTQTAPGGLYQHRKIPRMYHN
jgi:hypothetical protein